MTTKTITKLDAAMSRYSTGEQAEFLIDMGTNEHGLSVIRELQKVLKSKGLPLLPDCAAADLSISIEDYANHMTSQNHDAKNYDMRQLANACIGEFHEHCEPKAAKVSRKDLAGALCEAFYRNFSTWKKHNKPRKNAE